MQGTSFALYGLHPPVSVPLVAGGGSYDLTMIMGCTVTMALRQAWEVFVAAVTY